VKGRLTVDGLMGRGGGEHERGTIDGQGTPASSKVAEYWETVTGF